MTPGEIEEIVARQHAEIERRERRSQSLAYLCGGLVTGLALGHLLSSWMVTW